MFEIDFFKTEKLSIAQLKRMAKRAKRKGNIKAYSAAVSESQNRAEQGVEAKMADLASKNAEKTLKTFTATHPELAEALKNARSKPLE